MGECVKIQEYSFGRIKIGGREYHEDVIIFPDKVFSGWWRREGHRLHLEDLKQVLDFKPKLLVVGTGSYGRMVVTEKVHKTLAEMNIGLVVLPTPQACEEYNKQLGKGVERVVAALHLTC